MTFSRRHFLKAAGQGIALTAIGVGPATRVAALPQTAPTLPSLPLPVTHETATFLVNGKAYAAAYEAQDDVVGSAGGEDWADWHQPQLQQGELRRVQRARGWPAALLLPHAGDGSRGQEDSDHRRRRHGDQSSSVAAHRTSARRGRLRILHGWLGGHGKGPARQEREIRPKTR